MKKQKKKKQTPEFEFPIWATLFTIAGISILCGLGFWQVERLEWKTALLTELSKATETGSMEKRLTMADLLRGEKTRKQFLPGYVVGRLDHNNEIIITPRTYKGLSGHHLITPLKLENGGTILINRGWLPEENIDPASRPKSLTPGITVIAGIARKPDAQNSFTPENDIKNNRWYWLDIQTAKQTHNLGNTSSYVLYEQQQGMRAYSFPLPLGTTWQPRNNHKQYALFWFSMAGLMFVFYILRFFVKR